MGGSFSLTGNWNKNQQGTLVNAASVMLSPEFGWFVGERWVAGFSPLFGFAAMSSNSDRSIRLGLSPYVRYRFLELKKFGLWAEGNANAYFIWNRSASDQGYSLSYGLGVRPILTYNLTERISLYGAVNLLSLSLNGYSTYYSDTGGWINSFSVGFSGQSNDVISALSEISIGFVYKF